MNTTAPSLALITPHLALDPSSAMRTHANLVHDRGALQIEVSPQQLSTLTGANATEDAAAATGTAGNGSASATASAQSTARTGTLSVSEILAMVENGITSIDQQARTIATEITRRTQLQEQLGDVMNRISAWRQQNPGANKDINSVNQSSSDWSDRVLDLDAPTEQRGPDGQPMSMRQILESAGVPASELPLTVEPRRIYNNSNLQQLEDVIRRHADNLGHDSELRTLELQQLVSRRGQILQLFSNMASAMNEGAKSIVNNIR